MLTNEGNQKVGSVLHLQIKKQQQFWCGVKTTPTVFTPSKSRVIHALEHLKLLTDGPQQRCQDWTFKTWLTLMWRWLRILKKKECGKSHKWKILHIFNVKRQQYDRTCSSSLRIQIRNCNLEGKRKFDYLTAADRKLRCTCCCSRIVYISGNAWELGRPINALLLEKNLGICEEGSRTFLSTVILRLQVSRHKEYFEFSQTQYR